MASRFLSLATRRRLGLKLYRVIFIRQNKDIREQAIGKSPNQYEDNWDFEHHRYSALVTNIEYDALRFSGCTN